MRSGWSFTRFVHINGRAVSEVTERCQVLSGNPPFSGSRLHTIQAVTDGKRPRKPDDVATLGFTDGLWWVVECCWLPDRDMRPDVKTVLSRLTDAAWAWDMR